jgi:hypothetical protein
LLLYAEKRSLRIYFLKIKKSLDYIVKIKK